VFARFFGSSNAFAEIFGDGSGSKSVYGLSIGVEARHQKKPERRKVKYSEFQCNLLVLIQILYSRKLSVLRWKIFIEAVRSTRLSLFADSSRDRRQRWKRKKHSSLTFARAGVMTP
jgi:hypothetical protein